MPADVREKLSAARGKRPQMKDPMQRVGSRTGRKATGSSVQAGQYVRRTFTFREEQLARIRSLAAEWDVSENDVARWLIDVGLAEVGDGRQPEIAPMGRRIVGR